MPKKFGPADRRIFLKSRDRLVQIFSFSQKQDGSIYCSSPDFEDAKWLSLEFKDGIPNEVRAEDIGEGKVSFHGSGMTGIRSHTETKHQLIVKGNQLLRKEENSAGVRHLYSAFIKEPKFVPRNSPPFNRKCDYSLNADEELKPLILVFLAVPHGNFELDLNFRFHQDDLINIPNDILGFNAFSLCYHNILWLAYRTKHMDRWPKHSHICYYDGYTIPLFIGTGPEAYRLEYRNPMYSMVGGHLKIAF